MGYVIKRKGDKTALSGFFPNANALGKVRDTLLFSDSSKMVFSSEGEALDFIEHIEKEIDLIKESPSNRKNLATLKRWSQALEPSPLRPARYLARAVAHSDENGECPEGSFPDELVAVGEGLEDLAYQIGIYCRMEGFKMERFSLEKSSFQLRRGKDLYRCRVYPGIKSFTQKELQRFVDLAAC